MPLPPVDEELPKDVEVQLSRLVADASEQLLQQSQTEAQQEQAAQQAQDPIVQMRQAELKLKEAELQSKAAKDQATVQLEAARIQSQEKQTTAKILADAAKEDEILKVKQAIEGTKIGANLSQTNKLPEEGE